MSLQDWLRSGWLIEHETSREEIADLLGVIDREVLDGNLWIVERKGVRIRTGTSGGEKPR